MKYLIIIFFIIFLNSCNYLKRYNHDYKLSKEDLIKEKMAHFGDFSLNKDDVNLVTQSNYYIGDVKYQNEAYFIGYFNKFNKVKIIRVFNKLWSSNKQINTLIINSNDSIFSKNNLNFDTIYGEQDNNEIGVTLVNDERNSISNWDIDKIEDIINFSKYKLTKCYIKECASLFP